MSNGQKQEKWNKWLDNVVEQSKNNREDHIEITKQLGEISTKLASIGTTVESLKGLGPKVQEIEVRCSRCRTEIRQLLAGTPVSAAAENPGNPGKHVLRSTALIPVLLTFIYGLLRAGEWAFFRFIEFISRHTP